MGWRRAVVRFVWEVGWVAGAAKTAGMANNKARCFFVQDNMVSDNRNKYVQIYFQICIYIILKRSVEDLGCRC